MENKNGKKIDKMTIILLTVLVFGLCLIGYPSFADAWNRYHSYHAINSYTERLENIEDSELTAMIEAAQEYNSRLSERSASYNLTEEEMQEYKSLLDVDGKGMMGYVYIPKIRVTLPVYHTVDDSVIQTAIGHIPGTSLPVGGDSTHCVISGHRGLPSAKLFTDINLLKEGDTFMLQVLDETLTYEVDQIHTVLPEDVKDLNIEEGKDYCTMVTCTPYGVNTHRLLVRGHRVETTEAIHVSADAVQMDQKYMAFAIGGVILFVLLMIMFIRKWKNR